MNSPISKIPSRNEIVRSKTFFDHMKGERSTTAIGAELKVLFDANETLEMDKNQYVTDTIQAVIDKDELLLANSEGLLKAVRRKFSEDAAPLRPESGMFDNPEDFANYRAAIQYPIGLSWNIYVDAFRRWYVDEWLGNSPSGLLIKQQRESPPVPAPTPDFEEENRYRSFNRFCLDKKAHPLMPSGTPKRRG